MNAVRRRVSPRAVRRLGPVAAGLVAWLIALAVVRPSAFAVHWAHLLLAFAPLVVVPLGLPLFGASRATGWARRAWGVVEAVALPAAALFAVAFLLDPGPVAALLVAPWLAVTGCLAVLGCARAREHLRGPPSALCLDAALVFIVVGAGWAVLDRLAVRPLGFEPVIVLLTAIHFHYAGYVLPLVTGVLLARETGWIGRVAGSGVIVGVPLVAVGITTTQLGGGPWLEVVAAWTLGGAGLIVATLMARRAWAAGAAVGVLWLTAAASLAGSMTLAIAYGSRALIDVAWLDVPWMRALHGTANALGFALGGLLGARVDRKTAGHPGQGTL